MSSQQYRAVATDILKNVYLPVVRNQLNNSTYLLQNIGTNTEDFSGLQIVMALKKGRNLSTAGRADNAELPTPGRQSYDQATFGTKYVYSRFSISGPLIASARTSNEGAFVSALQAEIDGTIEDAKDHQNFMMWSDGTGSLARCTSGVTSATIKVDNPRYFVDRIGLRVDHTTTSGTAVTSDIGVVGYNIANSTVTLSAAVSISAGHVLIRPSSFRRDLNGLRIHVDTSNICGTGLYQGIDRTAAANAFYKASVLDNSGTNRALTLNLMQDAFDTVALASGEEPDCMFTTYALRNKYIQLMESQKRFVNNLKLDGGWSAVEYNRQPLMVDKYATKNNMYFLKKKSFKMYVMKDWGWMDEDGQMLEKINDYDGYVATLLAYKEMVCERPNLNCRLGDLTE